MRLGWWRAAAWLALGCSGSAAGVGNVPIDDTDPPRQADGAADDGSGSTARLSGAGAAGRDESGAGSTAPPGGGVGGTLGPSTGGGAAGLGGAGGAAGAGSGGLGGSSGSGGSGGAGSGGAGSGGSAGCAVPRYTDADGDGYGDAATAAHCTALGPVVGGDCDDADPDVHPEQTRAFSEPRADGSFDYDCDGLEDGNDELGTCPDTSGAEPVPGSEGWIEVCGLATSSGCESVLYEAPPACGKEGAWKTNAASCDGVTAVVRRRCR